MRPVVRICQLDGIENTPALPLAAGMLVAAAQQEPRIAAGFAFDLTVLRGPIHEVVEGLGDCYAVGFSLYPWNTAFSLAVISAARTRWPHTRIVVGGPSLPNRPEDIKRFLAEHPAIDVLVRGEGEWTFRDLLLAYLDNRCLSEVNSIVFRGKDGLQFTSDASRVTDFSQTASPYLTGVFDDLLERHPGHFSMAMLETNRGCPFSCTFCDWSLTKQVIELPLDRVLGEIDWLAQHNFVNLCVVDANFGIRRRDHDIARHMARVKDKTGKPSFCYFYLTKNNYRKNLQTIEIFRDAGIRCSVGLAVQDFDEDVLNAVKRDNIQSDETHILRRICADRNIPTRNELIFGLPAQTYASFTHSVLEAMPPYPEHECVIFICRLLANTELANPEQRTLHAIETRRCVWTSRSGIDQANMDEVQEIVVGTAAMPLPEWKRTYSFVYVASACYNLGLLRLVMRALPHLFNISVQSFIEAILTGIAQAPPGTVLHDMGEVVQRYLRSILQEGPYILPLKDCGATRWDVDEAIAICAIRRVDPFFEAIREVTESLFEDNGAARDLVDELFAFQRMALPRAGHTESEAVTFAHDWAHYFAHPTKAVPLPHRWTRVEFCPPPIAYLSDLSAFATTYCAMMKARSSTSTPMQGYQSVWSEVSRESA